MTFPQKRKFKITHLAATLRPNFMFLVTTGQSSLYPDLTQKVPIAKKLLILCGCFERCADFYLNQ